MPSPAHRRRRRCGDCAEQPEARCRCVEGAEQPEEEVEMGCSRWQDLPCDLVRSVAERLSGVDDFLCLRAVCKTWSEGLTGFRPALRAHFPWLVPTAKITSKEVSAALPMYSPTNRRFNRFPGVLPTTPHLPRVVGRHHGWLVTVDLGSLDFHVFNPVTGDRANLPSFSTLLPNVVNEKDIFFKKVAFSSTPSDVVAVAAVLYCFKKAFAIVFAKVGDRTWSGRIGLSFFVTDIIYYRGNFFVINNLGQYSIIDPPVGPEEPPRLVVASSQIPLLSLRYCRGGCYLMLVLSPSSGHLLAVGTRGTRTNRFVIIKYSPAPPSSSSHDSHDCWVEIKDLGDEALFIARGYAMLLPASAAAADDGGISIRRNCVYYTYGRSRDVELGCIFDLGKGIEQDLGHRISANNSSSWSLIKDSCCWFLPSLS